MLFDLHSKESLTELFGRDDALNMLVELIETKRWIVIFGKRYTKYIIKSLNDSFSNRREQWHI